MSPFALFHKWMFCLGIQPKFFVAFCVLFCGKVSTMPHSTAVLELRSAGVGLARTCQPLISCLSIAVAAPQSWFLPTFY